MVNGSKEGASTYAISQQSENKLENAGGPR